MYKGNKNFKVANCHRKSFEPLVQRGLAVTPAQMADMAAHGVAVSSQNAASFSDGQINPSWDMPIERLRGIDMADAWNASKDAQAKIRKAHSKDRQLYPDSSTSN